MEGMTTFLPKDICYIGVLTSKISYKSSSGLRSKGHPEGHSITFILIKAFSEPEERAGG